jgi:hypothetical protein
LDETSGLRFLFAHEAGEGSPLHVVQRHGTSVAEAIATYFADGATTIWNPTNKRFETRTDTPALYWAWHASGAILVISCFRQGDRHA